MNVLQPVTNIMTKELVTVDPKDNLSVVKEVFEKHNIHHLPVVRFKSIIGLISSSDFNRFLHGVYLKSDKGDMLIENTRLNTWKAADIMTTKLATISSSDSIRIALEVFKTNRFHALPIVDDDELVGILTTFDVIEALNGAPINLEDYKKQTVI